jgi:hypothetical protein
VSRHQNAGQNYDLKKKENVSQFIYLGKTITHQNLIQDEMRD